MESWHSRNMSRGQQPKLRRSLGAEGGIRQTGGGGGSIVGNRKLLANVAMSVLLYGTKIWADAINAREYQRTEMVLVQWKAA